MKKMSISFNKLDSNEYEDLSCTVDNSLASGLSYQISMSKDIREDTISEVLRIELSKYGINGDIKEYESFQKAVNLIFDYYDKKILDHDPFVRLDEEGVGELIKHTVKLARGKKANFKIGVCGEQGSNSDSVKFLLNAGVSYVSCSPYRVPIAILAAAIASIK